MATYTVSVDPGKKLLLVETIGVLELDEFMAQHKENMAAAKKLQSPNGFYMLVDNSQSQILKPEVAAVIDEVAGEIFKLGVKKIATVSASAVTRMQANRLIKQMGKQDVIQQFDTREEAMTWLFK